MAGTHTERDTETEMNKRRQNDSENHRDGDRIYRDENIGLKGGAHKHEDANTERKDTLGRQSAPPAVLSLSDFPCSLCRLVSHALHVIVNPIKDRPLERRQLETETNKRTRQRQTRGQNVRYGGKGG